MDNNDAFDRLKNRPRAAVPARNKSLTNSNDTMTEISHSLITNFSQDSITEVSKTTALASAPDTPNLEAVRRTFRIEQSIDSQLEQVCSQNRVTRETFLEAAYLACSENPDWMAVVLEKAQQRYCQRKKTGEQRKFATMSQKYKSDSSS
jgi:hypothetical protein